MLTYDEINEAYFNFQSDMNINISMPLFKHRPKLMLDNVAQVYSVTPEIAELYIGPIFFQKNINKKYLISCLYHEFTHIFDRITFLPDVDNRNLLFPYTEFHAAQIQLRKSLELFHNPMKKVGGRSTIYYETDFITLNKFCEIQENDLNAKLAIAIKKKAMWDLQVAIYTIIYNIGYYSIYKAYNIFPDLFIFNLPFDYIQDRMDKLINLLLNEKASDELCIITNNIIEEIVYDIYNHEIQESV